MTLPAEEEGHATLITHRAGCALFGCVETDRNNGAVLAGIQHDGLLTFDQKRLIYAPSEHGTESNETQ